MADWLRRATHDLALRGNASWFGPGSRIQSGEASMPEDRLAATDASAGAQFVDDAASSCTVSTSSSTQRRADAAALQRLARFFGGDDLSSQSSADFSPSRASCRPWSAFRAARMTWCGIAAYLNRAAQRCLVPVCRSICHYLQDPRPRLDTVS
ncbi:unnamed protein product [Symbiodinium sp. CCMP2592]|nr:unnamed protein product [Symbiodinium sp. CCMP2592]CAE7327077.1 unnamed protein product [Symbiodinium sp. CCMP2592]CAE7416081.1 unnamed protein product [Symbiodinium sp. CCMP2592]